MWCSPSRAARIEHKLEKIMSALEDLQATAAIVLSTEQSAIDLLNALKAQLDAALANNDTAALQQLSADLGAKTAALQAAIDADTTKNPGA